MDIPEWGLSYWQMYHDISSGLRRIFDGCCFPVPWSEFKAWADVSGLQIRSDEFALLRAMDVAFCDEMNKELSAYQARARDKSEQEAARAKR